MKTAEPAGRTRRAPARRRRIGVKILAGAALALGGASAPGEEGAPPFQGHDELRALAQAYAAREAGRDGARVEVEAGAIDPRLKLPACAARLEAFRPPGAQPVGHTTVGLRCRSGSPWTLYLPVRVRAWQHVVVAARAVPRAALLAPADLRLEPREAAELGRGYLRRPEEAVGKQTARALAAGSVIAPSALASPLLVRRGDRVTVLAGNGSLEVRATAEALGDARAGETVRLRNPLTQKIISGIVEAGGTVRIPL